MADKVEVSKSQAQGVLVYQVDNPIEGGGVVPPVHSIYSVPGSIVWFQSLGFMPSSILGSYDQAKTLNYAVSKLMGYFIHCMNKIGYISGNTSF